MGQRKNLRRFSFLLQTKPATRSSYCRTVYIMCKTSKVTVIFFTCQSLKWSILELMQPASKCSISSGDWLGGKESEPRGNARVRVGGKGMLSFLTPFPRPRDSSRLPLACDFSPDPLSHSIPQRALCVVGRLGRGRNESAGGTMGLFPVSVYLFARKNIFIQLFNILQK